MTRADVPKIVSGGLGSSWWLRLPTGRPYGRQHVWSSHVTWREALAAVASWYAERAA